MYPEEHPAGLFAWPKKRPRAKKIFSLEENYSVSEGYIRADPTKPP